jgi:dienelactone hydrolase
MLAESIGILTFEVRMRLAGLLVAVAALCLAYPDAAHGADAAAVDGLRTYLSTPASERPPIGEQPFAIAPLSRDDAAAARDLLIDDWRTRLRAERQPEIDRGVIALDGLDMPIFVKVFGDKPASGRSLFISMHGGGNAPPRVNDQQWRNQQRLYEPAEGVYVAPRAPTNTWNLWHEPHIDRLFDRLIEDMVVIHDVDPNRVYLMGYSAGGDGVYQLAPRMADRFAAVAMMAGHPNESQPLGLRNLPFALHVGALDDGYGRNRIAAEWGEKLKALHEADPEGYVNVVELHEGKGHWMDREDAAAVPWMAKFTRDPFPRRVVWRQDDITHQRFYWLAVDADQAKGGAEARAAVDGQEISVEATDVEKIAIRVAEELLDLDKEVVIRTGDRELFRGEIQRTIAAMAKSLTERGDPASIFVGEVRVDLAH